MSAPVLVTTWIEVARSRETLYAFLAGALGAPPTPALVEDARDGSLLADAASLDAPTAADLLQAFARRRDATSALVQSLDVEYTSLFVLPSAGRAQPFESIYRDPEQRLGGPVTVAVERAYRHAGAEPSFERIHASDHLAMELEFMAFLCAREREAWEAARPDVARRCLELGQAFLAEHLGLWLADFAHDVRECATTELYPALATLAAAFVRADAEDIAAALADLPDDPAKTDGA